MIRIVLVEETIMMENPTQTNPEIQPAEESQQPAPAPERRPNSMVSRVTDIIYFVLGAAEILLAFNLFLRLFGGNPFNPIVNAIYSLTYPLIYPFMDMFQQGYGRFDRPVGLMPETLIAMVAYLVVAWVIVKIIQWVADSR
jgi:hypothetical protein